MWLLKEHLKEFDIDITEPPKHVDYDYTIKMFKEVKKQKRSPEEVATQIIYRIKEYIKDFEVVSGYLNINLDWEKVIDKWESLFSFNTPKIKIMVEHTSVNPNKALHIGHLRNAILGDSIVRFFKALGYKVEVLNYIDDTGSQIADVIVGLYFLGFPENPEDINIERLVDSIIQFLKKEGLYKRDIERNIKDIIKNRIRILKKIYGYTIPKKFDHYCGDFIYVIVNQLYKLIPDLEKYRAIVIKKIEKGNNEIYKLNKKIVKKVLEEQLKTLWNFDIYYDLLNKESDILHFNLWNKTFEILKEKGIIEFVTEGDKKGTWSIDLTRWKEFKNLTDKYKVLVRSDGTTVYLAKDIAYAFWKHGLIDIDFKYSIFCIQPNGNELWETDINGKENPKEFGKADISINVIGSEQSYLQSILSKIINEVSRGKSKYIYYGYGLVMLSKNTASLFGMDSDKEVIRMSGRKGIYINVDNLLEKTIELAKKKIAERHTNLSDKDLEILAFKIARSTISFEILKYDRNKTVVFDLERMTNIDEGNALYLMYTYARIKSLLEKSGIKDFKEYIRCIKDLNDYERRLLKIVFLFKDVVLEISSSLELNLLAEYSLKLARTFNEFYQNVPILPELDEKPYRIFLVYLTQQILEKLYYILKIDGVSKV